MLHPFSGFTCSVSQLQVESRGSVMIRSADATEPPAIRYNYLATDWDRRVMVDGLKFVRRIVTTPPLAGYVTTEEQPGPKVRSDDEWLPVVRGNGETVFPPPPTGPPLEGKPAQGGGRAPARHRRRRPAGDRCLGHAHGTVGEHQRRGDRRRRKRRRHRQAGRLPIIGRCGKGSLWS